MDGMALLLLLLAALLAGPAARASGPIIVSTWNFEGAAEAAWEEINRAGATPIDAVEVRRMECDSV